MSTFSPDDTHFFHFIQAQNALVLVAPIVADCMKLYQQVQEHKPDAESAPYYQELAKRYQTELSQIGCRLRDPALGTVEFPTRYQDRVVALSWQFGEKKISYWHELQPDFVVRKKITPSFLSEIVLALHQHNVPTI